MIFSFHPEAEREFIEAIEYYESIEPGLGFDFSLEVHSAIQSIVSHPNAWLLLADEIRRRLVNRFPYGVLYSMEQGDIIILAVMHLRRRPGYWKNRR